MAILVEQQLYKDKNQS